MSRSYYPLDKALTLAGFEKTDDFSYQKGTISITNDPTKQELRKNGYSFSTLNQKISRFGQDYISEQVLESLLNKQLEYRFFRLTMEETESLTWFTDFPGLVAHAGGTHRGRQYNSFYTNSLEAL